MVKILGISGSPRQAATYFAVQEALKAAAEVGGVETEFISLKGKKINFCLHCDYCVRNKSHCLQKDDMSEILDKMAAADGFILGSPVYEGSMSGQLKTMLDRLRPTYLVYDNGFRNKVGGAIAVGGDRNGGVESTIKGILDFYHIFEVITVGGIAPGGNYGGTVWSQDRRAEGAKADENGMETVRKLGRRVAQVTKLVNARD
ncbi:MAG TPA: flavodoxin family protein [Bacillota bacterium]|jgi:multimeric flavodoxin WrbA